MGVTTGNGGVVKSGSITIGEILSWSVSESAATIDSTQLSDTARTFASGTTQWTADFDVHWDKDDSGQNTITNGSTIVVHFHPEDASSGNADWTGSLIITGINTSGSLDANVDASISGQGTGTLTKGTV